MKPPFPVPTAPRPWSLALLGLLLLAHAAPAWAAGKIHLIITASNDDPNIGQSCQVDVENVLTYFQTNTEDDQLVVTAITDKTNPPLAPETVLKHIQSLQGKVAADDTVVFYYSGHGAFDAEQYHYMDMAKGPLPRLKVRDAILALDPKPRLVVLATDCCSAYKNIKGVRPPSRPARPRQLDPVVQALFFRAAGIADFNACSEGQVATGNNEIGGAFTAGWIKVMAAGLTSIDTNNDGALTWREFFPQAIEATSANWKNAHPEGVDVPGFGHQDDQIPQAYNLPVDPQRDPKPRYALGVTVLNHRDEDDVRDGVIVTKVAPGSAAERMGLKRNDIIWKIDGKRVRTINDFDMCLSESERRQTLQPTINIEIGTKEVSPTEVRHSLKSGRLDRIAGG